jgi:hypothetical protein
VLGQNDDTVVQGEVFRPHELISADVGTDTAPAVGLSGVTSPARADLLQQKFLNRKFVETASKMNEDVDR